jgi:DNA-binding transcriptional regulator YiaG
MKYFYDRQVDSLYLTLADRPYGDSVEAAPGVVLDFDRDGRLIGLDLEHASTMIDVADLALHEQPARADRDAAILDGTRLKQVREALGLSQVELGRKLSVSANTIARWERGELKIEHPSMLQLALAALERNDEIDEGRRRATRMLSSKTSSDSQPARARKKNTA